MGKKLAGFINAARSTGPRDSILAFLPLQCAELSRFPYSVPLGVKRDEWYGEGEGGMDVCDSEDEEEEEEEEEEGDVGGPLPMFNGSDQSD